ncbi:YuzD family protein [Desertibacillus haloalkaliphilus]|uniref:YuzD family protein n=1 Tax=Desertibacillus haloalkaliphilus TaxID=1328930 RepID=UPI001C275CC8|nr:YuzD family protein [Desertibacillus haloalkaliphilus]MBU8905399.1 YuzD family protein [Desertibacillus haloalkaliphilus]
MTHLEFTVYGAEEKCASCVHLPSSWETKEWLEAAIQRKYPDAEVVFHYVDLYQPQNQAEEQMTKRIIAEDLIYPVVVFNDDIVAEGNPRLKTIYEKIESYL